MTKEEAKAIEVLKKTLPYTSEFADARRVAIRSIEAWDAVKKDLADMWLEGYSPYTEVMEIIDRHLKDDYCSFGERREDGI